MRAFTINLESGNCTLSDSLTKEVIHQGSYKGIRAATEAMKDKIFTEIIKRKMKVAK